MQLRKQSWSDRYRLETEDVLNSKTINGEGCRSVKASQQEGQSPAHNHFEKVSRATSSLVTKSSYEVVILMALVN